MSDEAMSPDHIGTADFIADPYPAFAKFRDSSPVRYLRMPASRTGLPEDIYSYAILRHADVKAAVRDTDTFSSNASAVIKILPQYPLLQDDPPRHSHLRRLVNKAFYAQKLDGLGKVVEQIAGELLATVATGSAVDAVLNYTLPMPLRVIGALLGVPREDLPMFRSYADGLISYSMLNPDERKQKIQALMAYITSMVAARRAEPKDDMITALTQAEVDGEALTDSEIVRLGALLLVAGHETTTHLLGNMLGILADRPELYEQVRKDRGLVDPIIEETLRYHSPVMRLSRVTTKDAVVAGVTIPKDSLVDVYYGSANRDPEVYEDPDTFRLDRSVKEHMGFGHGIHVCLGAPLARLEAKMTLNLFLDRYAAIERGTEAPERQRTAHGVYGYRSLPLVLRT